MPCDSITTISLNMGRVVPDVFSATLKALGLKGTAQSFSGRLNDTYIDGSIDASGNLSITGAYASEDLGGIIRREYTKQTVLGQAVKKGWKARVLNDGKIEVIKTQKWQA